MGLSVGATSGLAIGGVILSLVAAWWTKEWIKKLQDKKNQAYKQLEAGRKNSNINEEKVRAISFDQRGLFKTKSNSRPASLASNKLSPATTFADWAQAPLSGNSSLSRQSSGSTLQVPHPAKQKPSSLRIESFESNLKTSTITFGPTSGACICPLPSIQSFGSTPAGGSSTWISPLDVRLSRLTTPGTPTPPRPTSFLPQLQFPAELGRDGLPPSPPATPTMSTKSGTTQIISSAALTTAAPATQLFACLEPPKARLSWRSTSLLVIHHTGPTIVDRCQGSTFFVCGDVNRPCSCKSNKSSQIIPSPPLPQNEVSHTPKSPVPDPSFLESPLLKSDTEVLQESMVSKRSVSIYRPVSALRSSEVVATRKSVPTPSMYSSSSTSVGEERSDSKHRSQKFAAKRSPSQRRSSSADMSNRTDSVLPHSETTSNNTCNPEKTGNVDPDHIHRDLTRQSSNSGSVEDFIIDFDKLRSLPISDAHVISPHPASHSITSLSDLTKQSPQDPIRKPFLDLNTPAPERLSVRHSASVHGRWASDASIGDLYDAYYRESQHIN